MQEKVSLSFGCVDYRKDFPLCFMGAGHTRGESSEAAELIAMKDPIRAARKEGVSEIMQVLDSLDCVNVVN